MFCHSEKGAYPENALYGHIKLAFLLTVYVFRFEKRRREKQEERKKKKKKREREKNYSRQLLSIPLYLDSHKNPASFCRHRFSDHSLDSTLGAVGGTDDVPLFFKGVCFCFVQIVVIRQASYLLRPNLPRRKRRRIQEAVALFGAKPFYALTSKYVKREWAIMDTWCWRSQIMLWSWPFM